ncbi:MAG TPA: hypothetical protein VIT88_13225, partial [Pyrinomonadaceae bacterium]
ALTSPDETFNQITVRGVTLEENPPLQPDGGGITSSLSADFIHLQNPLPPGASVNINFKLGVMKTGFYRFFVNIEASNFVQPVILD